jgi:hypothetical protein
MPISLLIPLITQVGLPLATELIKLSEANPATIITSTQMLALHQKWGTMTAADYLAQATAPKAP